MHALFPYTGSCLGDKASIPLNGTARLQVTKNESFAFIDVTDHEGVTAKQSPALEMTEKLEKLKVQAILTKLEKLDTIEKSVQILQETLAGMDSRIQSLESAQASAYRDINDFKESLDFAELAQMQENHREL